MATVRLTDNVKYEIKTRASNLFTKRIGEASTHFMSDDDWTKLSTDVLNTYLQANGWADDYKTAAERGWLPAHTDYHLVSLNDHEMRRTMYFGVSKGYTRAFKPLPEIIKREGIRLTSPIFDDLVAKIKAWDENHKQVTAERQAFVTKVDTFLERHTTLKQALAEWPGVWELVPTHIQARHNEPDVRTQKAQTAKQEDPFDTSDLNTHIVTARIVGDGR